MLFPLGMDAPEQSRFRAEHSLPETGDPHRKSLAISNTRVEFYNTFAFQARLIPGAALLTMVEEHLKLTGPYRATTANLPHKSVRSEIHLTGGSSVFVANFKSQDLPEQIMNLWLPLSSTSLHGSFPCIPQMSPVG